MPDTRVGQMAGWEFACEPDLTPPAPSLLRPPFGSYKKLIEFAGTGAAANGKDEDDSDYEPDEKCVGLGWVAGW